jgi:hypothetical protein
MVSYDRGRNSGKAAARGPRLAFRIPKFRGTGLAFDDEMRKDSPAKGERAALRHLEEPSGSTGVGKTAY